MQPVIQYPNWTPVLCRYKPFLDNSYSIKIHFEYIAGFLASSHKGYVVDQNLQIIKKNTFTWILLILVQPFYRLFGSDAFSHVRVHAVAQKILTLCDKEKAQLAKENHFLFQLTKTEILDHLNSRTHQKYANQLNPIGERLLALTPPPLPPINTLAPVWPADFANLGMPQPQSEQIRRIFDTALLRIRNAPHRYDLKVEEHVERGSSAYPSRDDRKVRELHLIDRWAWNPIAIEKHSIPIEATIERDPDKRLLHINLNNQIGPGDRLTYDVLTGNITPAPPPNYLPEVIWQRNPKAMGITTAADGEAIRKVFDRVLPLLRNAPHRYRLEFSKIGRKKDCLRELILKERRWDQGTFAEVERHRIPLSLRLSYDPNRFLQEISLLSKKKVGEGAQTKVKVCYNFFARNRFVRKKTNDPFFKELMEKMAKQRLRGLVPVLGTQQIGVKTEVHEAFSTKTLEAALKKKQFDTFPKKLSAIMDLAHGLHNFHSISHPGLSYQKLRPYYHGTNHTGPFNLAHKDIKPANILTNKEGNQAKFTDFGGADPHIVCGTPGFMAPEVIDFMYPQPCSIRTLDDGSKSPNFNLRCGQPSDMWSLALVFVMILTNDESKIYPGKPPIPCIESALKKLIQTQTAPIISQYELNNNLSTLEKKNIADTVPCDRPKVQKLWNLVHQMLYVNYMARISSKKLVEQLGLIEKSR
jgi:serine/threonine protein kinase